MCSGYNIICSIIWQKQMLVVRTQDTSLRSNLLTVVFTLFPLAAWVFMVRSKIIIQMSRKMKGFFQHPFVVMTRTKAPKSPAPSGLTFEQQREYLLNMKRQDIEAKKRQLQQNNAIVQSLKQTLATANTSVEAQKQELEALLQSLREQQRQKQLELQGCQQIQGIDPEQFKVWKEESARSNHKNKMKALKQEFQKIKSAKMSEIEKLRQELDQVKNQQKQLTLKLEMLKGEETHIPQTEEVIPSESEEDVPSTDQIISQISRLKQSIDDLEEMNANLINKVKEDLDCNMWGIMEKFEKSRERIQTQMNKLISIMQKPNKQVFRKVQNPDKIAQPSTLIEDYENRLKKIQESLPEQLRNQKILECLRPLPWRTIKGITIENNTHLAIHERFQRLNHELAEAEDLNKQYKSALAKKEQQIKITNQKIREYEQKIRELRDQL